MVALARLKPLRRDTKGPGNVQDPGSVAVAAVLQVTDQATADAGLARQVFLSPLAAHALRPYTFTSSIHHSIFWHRCDAMAS